MFVSLTFVSSVKIWFFKVTCSIILLVMFVSSTLGPTVVNSIYSKQLFLIITTKKFYIVVPNTNFEALNFEQKT
jgi:hypothetical protein